MSNLSKSILICLVLSFQLLSSQSFAQMSEDQFQQYVAEQYLTEMVDVANNVQLQLDVKYPIGGVDVSDKCVAFMTKEMFLGENGKNIFASFKKHANVLPNLVHGGSLARHCPKYPEMNIDQKGLVWVVLLTMMAHFESSCNPAAKAKGPNGTAYGYYQLHLGKEAQYDGELNLCLKNASKSGKLSNECTLGIMQRQLVNQNNEIFSSKSYWDVLRPSGESKKHDDIQKALKNSSLCSPKII